MAVGSLAVYWRRYCNKIRHGNQLIMHRARLRVAGRVNNYGQQLAEHHLIR